MAPITTATENYKVWHSGRNDSGMWDRDNAYDDMAILYSGIISAVGEQLRHSGRAGANVSEWEVTWPRRATEED